MREEKTYYCADCHRLTVRRRSNYQPRICLPCGVQRAARAAEQMATHSGEAWDRFTMSAGYPYREVPPKT